MRIPTTLVRIGCTVFLVIGRGPSASAETKVYFGNLHAHSNLSDGNKDTRPQDAYRIAHADGMLDFMSLSEHNHMLTTDEMESLTQASRQGSSGSFAALYGQEYSYLSQTTGFNHTNIHNYPIAIPKALCGQYRRVFAELLPGYIMEHPDEVIVAGFNHPDDIDVDYGLDADYDGDWGDFVRDLDPFVQLIAIANGPADVDRKTSVPSSSERFIYRPFQLYTRWFDYLSHGMHLAPKIDHDTHSPTYGFRVAGRTAVWVEGNLSRDKVLRALANRHCYATQDMNLRVIATVGHEFLPGDIIEEPVESPVKMDLQISDDDEPNAAYEIAIYSGVPGDGIRPAKVATLSQALNGDGSVTIDLPVEVGTSVYFIARIDQTSSDPVNGSPKNTAWLAPVWFESSAEVDDSDDTSQYASSKRSKVYHFIDCRVVGSIRPNNLQYHTSVPEGKRLHQGCPWH